MGLSYGRKLQTHRSIGVLGSVAIMTLYQNNIRPFLNLFPKEVLASNYKDGGYAPVTSFHALQQNFVQYNTKDRINIIAIDIDTHRDGGAWLDHDLPQPTWTVFTDRGVQMSWVLANPIFLCDTNKHKKRDFKYAKDILNKIVYALDADIDAIGFNRIFRNPLTHDTHYSDTRVNLSDFIHLNTPSQEWWDKLKSKTKKEHINDTLFKDIHVPKEILDFSDMREGDGRNEAMFHRLRFYAYSQARAGEYEEFDLAHRGLTMNYQFLEPLDNKELNRIIASIDNFIMTKYNGENYMGSTTPEERKEIARKNGLKGGVARRKESRTRILATLNQMESFGIKISARDLAERAKSDKNTVSSYLKELGYKEVSRKEGWKQ